MHKYTNRKKTKMSEHSNFQQTHKSPSQFCHKSLANLIRIYASFDSTSNCCNFDPNHQMPSFENQKQIMPQSLLQGVRDQILKV